MINRAESHAPAGVSRLLCSLAELSRAHPHQRKLLVGPDVNYGRELLLNLARHTGGWIGWEATTLRKVAEAIAFVPLSERGLHIAGDVEIGAVIGRSLESAIESGQVSDRFAALAGSLGFRRALRDTLLEFRAAGVSPDDVRAGAAPDSPAHDLPAVLERYERMLAELRFADPAEIFAIALQSFDQEAGFALADARIALAPSLSTHGLPGALLSRLRERGAQLASGDHPVGLQCTHVIGASGEPGGEVSTLACAAAAPLPDLEAIPIKASLVQTDFFAAATPSDELREVCRRVMAEGLRWDQVEIVTTDPDTYGIALDALCQRLGLGATMLAGIPLARTRLGRALDRWIRWLEDGLPADVLRQALEAGELAVPGDPSVASTALARELRVLQIGWGRDRYDAALARLEHGGHAAFIAQREHEGADELAERQASRNAVTAALAALLRDLLDGTPAVPERGSERPVRTSLSTLARAALRYLALVPVHGQAEAQTLERLSSRLVLLAEVEGAEVRFSAAVAELRDGLSDLRAWPLVTSERKPWSAAGGMPHLTDLAHAGATGRARIFVVGLDADRTNGGNRQDPLLPDAARRVIGHGRLATSGERRETSAWILGAALASLRGRVTLSYSTSGTLDGREAGPSPVILQAWRLATGDPSLSYEALRTALRPPASAVPTRDADGSLGGVLDGRDVWLDALADGALLRAGGGVLREGFPMLAAGFEAIEYARQPEISPYHGMVPDAVAALDPAAHADRAISPSALEQLSACPLAWFYRYGLGLRAPQDPEYDAARWLDALGRGNLLHEVFELFAREYQGRQAELAASEARERVLAIAGDVITRWREALPPPGEAVFDSEAAELRQAALAFLQMEREGFAAGDGTWAEFEMEFGLSSEPGVYRFSEGGTLLVRGRADRIDERPDGTLQVIDYKTGKSGRYTRNDKSAAYNGGRQLQPALYAAAVGSLRGRPVSRFEYRFPTDRGGNEAVVYSANELEGAREVVAGLLDHVRDGAFIPTTDSADCAYCDFQAICRTTREGFGKTHSPRAEWAKTHAAGLPLYSGMLRRRGEGPAVEIEVEA